MIYIENNCNDPHYNLAFEEYVFNHIESNDMILLLWQNEPSVIIGKYQNTAEEINAEYIYDNNVNVVRRNTGGGAVYHDLGNLNYSFIIPDVDSKIDFKTFTQPLIKALESQGITVEQTGRNDITIDGKKFSGNAQQYYHGRLLHHGTIMFDVGLEAVQRSLCVKPGKIRSKGIKSVRSRVTNLKPYFKEDMDVLEFKELLLNCFKSEYECVEYKLSQEELERVNELYHGKYMDWDWNYGKSPESDVMRSGYFRCGYIEFHFKMDQLRIRNLQLIGDFFSGGDIKDFTKLFEGVKYDRDSIMKVLNETDLNYFLGDITPEEIINTIL